MVRTANWRGTANCYVVGAGCLKGVLQVGVSSGSAATLTPLCQGIVVDIQFVVVVAVEEFNPRIKATTTACFVANRGAVHVKDTYITGLSDREGVVVHRIVPRAVDRCMRDERRDIDECIPNIWIGVQAERGAVYVLCLSDRVVRLDLADRSGPRSPSVYHHHGRHGREHYYYPSHVVFPSDPLTLRVIIHTSRLLSVLLRSGAVPYSFPCL